MADLCLAFINSNGEFECASDATIEGDLICGYTDHFTEFAVGEFKSNSSPTHKSDKSSTPAWVWVIVALIGFAVILGIIIAVAIKVAQRKSEKTDSMEMEKI